MDLLIKSISDYDLAKKATFKECELLKKKYNLNELESKLEIQHDGFFGYNPFANRTSIKDVYYIIKYESGSQIENFLRIHRINESENLGQFKEALKEYFRDLSLNQDVRNYIEKFKKLDFCIAEAEAELKKYINHVINKHEYGKDIEKYD